MLWGYCVAWLIQKAKVTLKSKTARAITPKAKQGVAAWLDREGVEVEKGVAILFKRVSKDFKTQEGNPNETTWKIGSTLNHPAPDLKSKECGEGKYHFCSRPYLCDQFRSKKGDHYIALSVPVKSLYAWPDAEYKHKIAGLKATVLYECNKMGKKI